MHSNQGQERMIVTPHVLTEKTYQSSSRRLSPRWARTTYTCTLCGEVFVHWYNIDDDIHKAAKDAGFDIDYCAGGEDATETNSGS